MANLLGTAKICWILAYLSQIMRLDHKLKALYSALTRSFLSKLISKGCVKVNSACVKKSGFLVDEGDIIEVDFPEIELRKDLKAENIALDVIYEDDDYLVINKGKGISVHPSTDSSQNAGTIVNAVMNHCGKSLSGINGEMRPGIVHRLDKDTTGVLIVAKNDKFHVHLAKQIEKRKVKKVYRLLVFGKPKDGLIEAPIARSEKDRKKMGVVKGGRNAKTAFKVLKYFPKNNVSLVEADLITGRTHQIRVHFRAIGFPVVGDKTYGNEKVNKVFKGKFAVESQLLHAYSYEFLDLQGKKKKYIAEPKDALLSSSNNPLD